MFLFTESYHTVIYAYALSLPYFPKSFQILYFGSVFFFVAGTPDTSRSNHLITLDDSCKPWRLSLKLFNILIVLESEHKLLKTCLKIILAFILP